MGLFGLGKKKEGVQDSDSQNANSLPPMPELPDLPKNMDVPPKPDSSDSKDTSSLDTSGLPDLNVPQNENSGDSNSLPSLPDFPEPPKIDTPNDVPEVDSASLENSDVNKSESSQDDFDFDIPDVADSDDVKDDDFDLDISDDVPEESDSDDGDDFLPKGYHDAKDTEESSVSKVAVPNAELPSEVKEDEPSSFVDDSRVSQFVKVEKYMKMTDIIGILKQDVDNSVEYGTQLVHFHDKKTIEINNVKNAISNMIEKLYEVNDICFKR